MLFKERIFVWWRQAGHVRGWLLVSAGLVTISGCSLESPVTPTPIALPATAPATAPSATASLPTNTPAPPTNTPAPPTPTEQMSKLDEILARTGDDRKIRCGVNNDQVGFATQDSAGTWTGFNIDFCRVIAAAVLGDAELIAPKGYNTPGVGIDALKNGDIDVLIRNVTQTSGRDMFLDVDFGPVIFYDAQRLLVPSDLNVRELKDLDGKTICVAEETTSLRNLIDLRQEWRQEPGISVAISQTASLSEAIRLYPAPCQVVSSDATQLELQKRTLSTPSEIFAYDLSYEPIAPVVRENDSRWRDVVSWAILATIAAVDFDITMEDAQSISKQDAGEASQQSDKVKRLLQLERVKRLLRSDGIEGFRPVRGLNSNFALQVISQVGNYEEIYDRNLGKEAFNIDAGANKFTREGGLLSGAPFR